MNWTTIIPLIPSILGMVGNLFSTAAPGAAPVANASVANILAAEMTFIKFVQTFLNDLQALKVIDFGGGTPLLVDGWAGAKTMAAAESIIPALAKFGVKVS